MEGTDYSVCRTMGNLLKRWPVIARMPGPFIAEPKHGQNMELGGYRTAVVNADLNQDIVRRCLRKFNEHIEVTISVKHAGVDEFVFEVLATPATAGFHEV